MRYWLKWAAFVLAAALLVLTFVNASWLAPAPTGAIRLIAHRGVAQIFDHRGVTRGTCTADRIEPPVHDYLENTTRSMLAAWQMGADFVEIDVVATRDGQVALFHDAKVDCLTDGSGTTAAKTMAELKALDPGYRYTADSGRTFPFRGRQAGTIPTLEEAAAAIPNSPIIFHFKGEEAREADALAAAIGRARRDPVKRGDIFYGPAAPVARIAALIPSAKAWSKDAALDCTRSYLLYGWTPIVPAACRNSVLAVPLNYQWAFWGWPNRTIQRMRSVGGQVVILGPYGEGRAAGLELPEQITRIPGSFKGLVWVDDIWTVGPSFRPRRDIRSAPQQKAADEGLKRRRERLGG